MILNKEMSKKIYSSLEGAKLVTQLSYKQTDVDNICQTINAINGLGYGERQLNGFNLEDYQIATQWKALIQPVEVKFSSDMLAKDFKDVEGYSEAKIDGARVLDPHKFAMLWTAITASYRASDTLESVQEYRTESLVATIGKHGLPKGKQLCIEDGIYIPCQVTAQWYEDYAYNFDVSTMLEKYLRSILLKVKAKQ